MSKKILFHQQRFLTAAEVLVVFCVLGILAALLLSGGALTEKRRTAEITRCQENLKILSQGLFLYSSDHCSVLPPYHDAAGLSLLQKAKYLPESAMISGCGDYLYYGGLMQIEMQPDMGMIRDTSENHCHGGNTAFGDGHVNFFMNTPNRHWFETDSYFQMDHRNSATAISKLNRKLPWSPSWTEK